VHPLSFHTDPEGFPRYRSTDNRWVPVGVWFVMELRNSPYQCLDLLALIDDVATGRETRTRWEGEAFDVLITAAAVSVVNTILDDQRGEYPLGEVRAAAEDYWHFLSDSLQVASDIEDWEETWSRTHPHRGSLF